MIPVIVTILAFFLLVILTIRGWNKAPARPSPTTQLDIVFLIVIAAGAGFDKFERNVILGAISAVIIYFILYFFWRGILAAIGRPGFPGSASLKQALVSGGIGVALLLVTLLMLKLFSIRPTPPSFIPTDGSRARDIAMTIGVGFFESIMFQAAVPHVVLTTTKSWRNSSTWAMVFSVLLFVTAHGTDLNIFRILQLGLLGSALLYISLRHSLGLCVLVHIGFNLFWLLTGA